MHLACGLLDQALTPFIERLRPDGPDVTLVARGSDGDEDTLDPSGVWLFGPGALKNVAATALPQGGGLDASIIAERVTAQEGKFCVQLVDGWQRYAGDPGDCSSSTGSRSTGSTHANKPLSNGRGTASERPVPRQIMAIGSRGGC